MIVVNAVIEADAASIDAMRDAIATMEAASRAEEGCHDYTFSVELNNPNIMRITEKWASMDALAAHFTMPHMAAFPGSHGGPPAEECQRQFLRSNGGKPAGTLKRRKLNAAARGFKCAAARASPSLERSHRHRDDLDWHRCRTRSA